MTKLLITFRIHQDSDYSDRYSSFTAAVRANSTKWWADPTSFYAVETKLTLDMFASKIYTGSEFNATKDMYLVLDAEKLDGRVRGPVADQDLFKILPFVKKL